MNDIICGIYMIKNKVNNKIYIGQSFNIKERWAKGHIKPLEMNNHINIHLQRSWNKYGKENFEFIIIEECIISELNKKEIFWIEFYDSFKNGYNRTLGGEGSRGLKFSEESKKLLSKNSYFNILKYWKGKHLSKETKQKLSISIKLTLKNMPEEKKQQMILNRKMNRKPFIMTDENKEKLRLANVGKIMSDETKEKISKAQKKLSNEQEIEIIDLLNQGIEGREIAKKYNICPASITNVKKKNIDKILPQYRHKTHGNRTYHLHSEETKIKLSESKCKLNNLQEREIIKLVNENIMLYKDIAKLYNISASVISRIKKKYIR